jgi:hypothetical protein
MLRTIVDFLIVRTLVVAWSGTLWYVVGAFVLGAVVGWAGGLLTT